MLLGQLQESAWATFLGPVGKGNLDRTSIPPPLESQKPLGNTGAAASLQDPRLQVSVRSWGRTSALPPSSRSSHLSNGPAHLGTPPRGRGGVFPHPGLILPSPENRLLHGACGVRGSRPSGAGPCLTAPGPQETLLERGRAAPATHLCPARSPAWGAAQVCHQAETQGLHRPPASCIHASCRAGEVPRKGRGQPRPGRPPRPEAALFLTAAGTHTHSCLLGHAAPTPTLA